MKNNEKKKFNLFKSVAFCLCSLMFVASFALFAVSLALSLVDITAGGHISFTASGVYAKVTGSVTGTKTTNTLDTLNFDASTESFTTPNSWKNMTLDFTSDNLITFTVNFQNLSDENPLYVSFTDGLTVTNVTTTRVLDGSTVTTFPTLEVPASTTKTVVITFKVDDIYKSVSSDFSLNMQLTDEAPAKDASTYTDLNFSYDSSTKTASVSANNTDISGQIVIPSKILKDDETYTVTSLEAYAFQDCGNVSSIELPNTITTINDYAFSNCGITSFKMPNSVTTLISYAFQNCQTLTSITLSENLTSIQKNTFDGCNNLTEIAIPDKVTEIGEFAFQYCTSLKTVKLSKTLTSIGENAFNTCAALTTITIPASVTLIGGGAFDFCSSLTSVVFENTTGWSSTDSAISSSSLADPATAATLLNNGSSEWTRS